MPSPELQSAIDSFDYRAYLKLNGYTDEQIPESLDEATKQKLFSIAYSEHFSNLVKERQLTTPGGLTPSAAEEEVEEEELETKPYLRPLFGLWEKELSAEELYKPEMLFPLLREEGIDVSDPYFDPEALSEEQSKKKLEPILDRYVEQIINKKTPKNAPELKGVGKDEFKQEFLQRQGLFAEDDIGSFLKIYKKNADREAIQQDVDERGTLGWLRDLAPVAANQGMDMLVSAIPAFVQQRLQGTRIPGTNIMLSDPLQQTAGEGTSWFTNKLLDLGVWARRKSSELIKEREKMNFKPRYGGMFEDYWDRGEWGNMGGALVEQLILNSSSTVQNILTPLFIAFGNRVVTPIFGAGGTIIGGAVGGPAGAGTGLAVGTRVGNAATAGIAAGMMGLGSLMTASDTIADLHELGIYDDAQVNKYLEHIWTAVALDSMSTLTEAAIIGGGRFIGPIGKNRQAIMAQRRANLAASRANGLDPMIVNKLAGRQLLRNRGLTNEANRRIWQRMATGDGAWRVMRRGALGMAVEGPQERQQEAINMDLVNMMTSANQEGMIEAGFTGWVNPFFTDLPQREGGYRFPDKLIRHRLTIAGLTGAIMGGVTTSFGTGIQEFTRARQKVKEEDHLTVTDKDGKTLIMRELATQRMRAKGLFQQMQAEGNGINSQTIVGVNLNQVEGNSFASFNGITGVGKSANDAFIDLTMKANANRRNIDLSTLTAVTDGHEVTLHNGEKVTFKGTNSEQTLRDLVNLHNSDNHPIVLRGGMTIEYDGSSARPYTITHANGTKVRTQSLYDNYALYNFGSNIDPNLVFDSILRRTGAPDVETNIGLNITQTGTFNFKSSEQAIRDSIDNSNGRLVLLDSTVSRKKAKQRIRANGNLQADRMKVADLEQGVIYDIKLKRGKNNSNAHVNVTARDFGGKSLRLDADIAKQTIRDAANPNALKNQIKLKTRAKEGITIQGEQVAGQNIWHFKDDQLAEISRLTGAALVRKETNLAEFALPGYRRKADGTMEEFGVIFALSLDENGKVTAHANGQDIAIEGINEYDSLVPGETNLYAHALQGGRFSTVGIDQNTGAITLRRTTAGGEDIEIVLGRRGTIDSYRVVSDNSARAQGMVDQAINARNAQTTAQQQAQQQMGRIVDPDLQQFTPSEISHMGLDPVTIHDRIKSIFSGEVFSEIQTMGTSFQQVRDMLTNRFGYPTDRFLVHQLINEAGTTNQWALIDKNGNVVSTFDNTTQGFRDFKQALDVDTMNDLLAIDDIEPYLMEQLAKNPTRPVMSFTDAEYQAAIKKFFDYHDAVFRPRPDVQNMMRSGERRAAIIKSYRIHFDDVYYKRVVLPDIASIRALYGSALEEGYGLWDPFNKEFQKDANGNVYFGTRAYIDSLRRNPQGGWVSAYTRMNPQPLFKLGNNHYSENEIVSAANQTSNLDLITEDIINDIIDRRLQGYRELPSERVLRGERRYIDILNEKIHREVQRLLDPKYNDINEIAAYYGSNFVRKKTWRRMMNGNYVYLGTDGSFYTETQVNSDNSIRNLVEWDWNQYPHPSQTMMAANAYSEIYIVTNDNGVTMLRQEAALRDNGGRVRPRADYNRDINRMVQRLRTADMLMLKHDTYDVNDQINDQIIDEDQETPLPPPDRRKIETDIRQELEQAAINAQSIEEFFDIYGAQVQQRYIVHDNATNLNVGRNGNTVDVGVDSLLTEAEVADYVKQHGFASTQELIPYYVFFTGDNTAIESFAPVVYESSFMDELRRPEKVAMIDISRRVDEQFHAEEARVGTQNQRREALRKQRAAVASGAANQSSTQGTPSQNPLGNSPHLAYADYLTRLFGKDSFVSLGAKVELWEGGISMANVMTNNTDLIYRDQNLGQGKRDMNNPEDSLDRELNSEVGSLWRSVKAKGLVRVHKTIADYFAAKPRVLQSLLEDYQLGKIAKSTKRAKNAIPFSEVRTAVAAMTQDEINTVVDTLGVQGYYDENEKTIHLIEEMIPRGNAANVLYHELAVHATMHLNYGNIAGQWMDIIRYLKAHQNDDTKLGKAVRRIIRNRKAELKLHPRDSNAYWEEVAAYIVEDFYGRLSFAERINAFFRSLFRSTGIIKQGEDITIADIVRFAKAKAKVTVSMSGKLRTSHQGYSHAHAPFFSMLGSAFHVDERTAQDQFESVDQYYNQVQYSDRLGMVHDRTTGILNESNLDHGHWVLARTPMFKKWFGDWENRPYSASKIVDTNGEPLVIYHNPKYDDDAYDEPFIGLNGNFGHSGKFIYDSLRENPYAEKLLGGRVAQSFINIRKPLHAHNYERMQQYMESLGYEQSSKRLNLDKLAASVRSNSSMRVIIEGIADYVADTEPTTSFADFMILNDNAILAGVSLTTMRESHQFLNGLFEAATTPRDSILVNEPVLNASTLEEWYETLETEEERQEWQSAVDTFERNLTPFENQMLRLSYNPDGYFTHLSRGHEDLTLSTREVIKDVLGAIDARYHSYGERDIIEFREAVQRTYDEIGNDGLFLDIFNMALHQARREELIFRLGEDLDVVTTPAYPVPTAQALLKEGNRELARNLKAAMMRDGYDGLLGSDDILMFHPDQAHDAAEFKRPFPARNIRPTQGIVDISGEQRVMEAIDGNITRDAKVLGVTPVRLRSEFREIYHALGDVYFSIRPYSRTENRQALQEAIRDYEQIAFNDETPFESVSNDREDVWYGQDDDGYTVAYNNVPAESAIPEVLRNYGVRFVEDLSEAERVQAQYEAAMSRQSDYIGNLYGHLLRRAGLLYEDDGSYLAGFNVGNTFILSHFAPRNIRAGARMMQNVANSYMKVMAAVPEYQGQMLERVGFRMVGQVPQIFNGELVLKNVYANNAVNEEDINEAYEKFSNGRSRAEVNALMQTARVITGRRENGTPAYFSRLGRQGAARLLGTPNYELEAQAEMLEAMGKDANTILLATGYKRDKDGHWRYEVSNIDHDFTDQFEDIVFGIISYHVRDALAGNPLTNYVVRDFLKYRENAARDIADRYSPINPSIFTGDRRQWKLSDIFSAPELYRAYPDLANIPVMIEGRLFDYDVMGSYDPDKKIININPDRAMRFLLSKLGLRKVSRYSSEYDPRDTMLHEIQHYIQEEEGLPGGTSSMGLREQLKESGRLTGIEKRESELATAKKELAEFEENSVSELRRLYSRIYYLVFLDFINDSTEYNFNEEGVLVDQANNPVKVERGGVFNIFLPESIKGETVKKSNLMKIIEALVEDSTPHIPEEDDLFDGSSLFIANISVRYTISDYKRANFNKYVGTDEIKFNENYQRLRNNVVRAQESLNDEYEKIFGPGIHSFSEAYNASMGEVEADAVGKRANLTQEELLRRPFETDMRVAPENQIDTDLFSPPGYFSILDPYSRILVRTPSFKENFGDWQNDPNPEMVLDQRGEPLRFPDGFHYGTGIVNLNEPPTYFSIAWSGSSSTFDKFSTDYVMSQTGMNVDGWGLYFTDDQLSAQTYALPTYEFIVDGVRYKKGETADGEIAYIGENGNEFLSWGAVYDALRQLEDMPLEYAIEYFEDTIRFYSSLENENGEEAVRRAQTSINFLRKANIEVFPIRGNMYKVDIPEKNEMFDKTVLVSEQSEHVRNALSNLLDKYENRITITGIDVESLKERILTESDEYSLSGSYLFNLLSGAFNSPRALSLALNEVGIKGTINYNHQGKQDKRDFVVFSDEAIKILERYPFPHQNIHAATELYTPPNEEVVYFSTIGSINTPLTASDLVNERDTISASDLGYFSMITNGELIDRLNKEPKVRDGQLYRMVVKNDEGNYYPVMATRIRGPKGDLIFSEPIPYGEWEQADERPELIFVNDKGKYKYPLMKDDGGRVDADYAPYIHSSTFPLNDQFTTAYKRPNLVVLRVEVPQSEITHPYRATFERDGKVHNAPNQTGIVEWNKGTVTKALGRSREVVLSRYGKAVEELSDAQVADIIVPELLEKKVGVPINVVTPGLLRELVQRGVEILNPVGFKTQYASQRAEAERLTRAAESIRSEGLNSEYFSILGPRDNAGLSSTENNVRYFSISTSNKFRGIQKRENISYPDAREEIAFYFSLSPKRRKNYQGQLLESKDLARELFKRYRSEVTDEVVESILNEFDTYGKDDFKIAMVLHWTIKGKTIPYDDRDILKEARDITLRRKMSLESVLKYDSPGALINEYKRNQLKPSGEPIDPETVPQLRKDNKIDHGDGIVSYEVQDDKEGQEAMRKIVNTHFGTKWSKWCLLYANMSGKLTDHSWDMWKLYNGLPKRAVFKNGRLIGFMATQNDYTYGNYILRDLTNSASRNILNSHNDIETLKARFHLTDGEVELIKKLHDINLYLEAWVKFRDVINSDRRGYRATNSEIIELRDTFRSFVKSDGFGTNLSEYEQEIFDEFQELDDTVRELNRLDHVSGSIGSLYVNDYRDFFIPKDIDKQTTFYRFMNLVYDRLENIEKNLNNEINSTVNNLYDYVPSPDGTGFIIADREGNAADLNWYNIDNIFILNNEGEYVNLGKVVEQWWDKSDTSHPNLDWARDDNNLLRIDLDSKDSNPDVLEAPPGEINFFSMRGMGEAFSNYDDDFYDRTEIVGSGGAYRLKNGKIFVDADEVGRENVPRITLYALIRENPDVLNNAKIADIVSKIRAWENSNDPRERAFSAEIRVLMAQDNVPDSAILAYAVRKMMSDGIDPSNPPNQTSPEGVFAAILSEFPALIGQAAGVSTSMVTMSAADLVTAANALAGVENVPIDVALPGTTFTDQALNQFQPEVTSSPFMNAVMNEVQELIANYDNAHFDTIDGRPHLVLGSRNGLVLDLTLNPLYIRNVIDQFINHTTDFGNFDTTDPNSTDDEQKGKPGNPFTHIVEKMGTNAQLNNRASQADVERFINTNLPAYIADRIQVVYNETSEFTTLFNDNEYGGVYRPVTADRKVIYIRAYDRNLSDVIGSIVHLTSNFGWTMWNNADFVPLMDELWTVLKHNIQTDIPTYYERLQGKPPTSSQKAALISAYLATKSRSIYDLAEFSRSPYVPSSEQQHMLDIAAKVKDQITQVELNIAKSFARDFANNEELVKEYSEKLLRMTMAPFYGKGMWFAYDVDYDNLKANNPNISDKYADWGHVMVFANDFGQVYKPIPISDDALTNQLMLQDYRRTKPFWKDVKRTIWRNWHPPMKNVGDTIIGLENTILLTRVWRAVTTEWGSALENVYSRVSAFDDKLIKRGIDTENFDRAKGYVQELQDRGITDKKLLDDAEIIDTFLRYGRQKMLQNVSDIRRLITYSAQRAEYWMRHDNCSERDIMKMHREMDRYAQRFVSDWEHRSYRAFSREDQDNLQEMWNILDGYSSPPSTNDWFSNTARDAQRDLARLEQDKTRGLISESDYAKRRRELRNTIKMYERLDALYHWTNQNVMARLPNLNSQNYRTEAAAVPQRVNTEMKTEIENIMTQVKNVGERGLLGKMDLIPAFRKRKLNENIPHDRLYMTFLDQVKNPAMGMLHNLDQQGKILDKLNFNLRFGESILQNGMGTMKGSRDHVNLGVDNLSWMESGSFLQYVKVDPFFLDEIRNEQEIQLNIREHFLGGLVNMLKQNFTVLNLRMMVSNYIGNISNMIATGQLFRWGHLKAGIIGINDRKLRSLLENNLEKSVKRLGSRENVAASIKEYNSIVEEYTREMERLNVWGSGTTSTDMSFYGNSGWEKIADYTAAIAEAMGVIDDTTHRSLNRLVGEKLKIARELYGYGDEWVKPLTYMNNRAVAMAKYRAQENWGRYEGRENSVEARLLDERIRDMASREAAILTMKETTTWELSPDAVRKLAAQKVRVVTPDFLLHGFQMARIMTVNVDRTFECAGEVARLMAKGKENLTEDERIYLKLVTGELVRRTIGQTLMTITMWNMAHWAGSLGMYAVGNIIAALRGAGEEDEEERKRRRGRARREDSSFAISPNEYTALSMLCNAVSMVSDLYAPLMWVEGKVGKEFYAINWQRINAAYTFGTVRPATVTPTFLDRAKHVLLELADLRSDPLSVQLADIIRGKNRYGQDITGKEQIMEALSLGTPQGLHQAKNIALGMKQLMLGTEDMSWDERRRNYPLSVYDLAGIKVRKYSVLDMIENTGRQVNKLQQEYGNAYKRNFFQTLERKLDMTDQDVADAVSTLVDNNTYQMDRIRYSMEAFRLLGIDRKTLEERLSISRNGSHKIMGRNEIGLLLAGRDVLTANVLTNLASKIKQLQNFQSDTNIPTGERRKVLENYQRAHRKLVEAMR